MSQLAKLVTKPLSISPYRKRTAGDIVERFEQVSYDADVSLDLAEDFILLDGTDNTVTATLATPAVGGICVVLKAINVANAVDVATEGDEQIDGSDTYAFTTANDAIVLISDSDGEWNIVSEFTNA